MRRILSTLTGLSLLFWRRHIGRADRRNWRKLNGAKVPSQYPPPVEAEHAMAVSSQRDATRAGTDILAAGGNAIDAAVAIGYALAVTHPCCGNVGGGGFATIHLANGKDTFINFREKAPGSRHLQHVSRTPRAT